MLHRTTFTATRSLMLALVLTITGRASAGVTTWTNPAGGSWADPSNWSNGVPSAADTAVLPPLDSDGYTIAMPASASVDALEVGAAVAGGEVVLDGGSLTVGGMASVGVGTAGALRLQGGVLQAGGLLVGMGDGDGSFRLRGGAFVVVGLAQSGDGGTGMIDVADGSRLLAGMVSLSAGSTLRIEAVAGPDAHVFVNSLSRGGRLELVAEPGLSLPSPFLWVLKSWSPMSGSFADVVVPVVGGYEIPVQQNAVWITVADFDPVVALDIVFDNDLMYPGFEYEIDVVEYLYSGATWTVEDPALWDWQVDGASAQLVFDKLFVLDLPPFSISVTMQAETYSVTSTRTVRPTPLPFEYERVAAAADGTPAEPTPAPFGAKAPARWTPDQRYVAFQCKATNLVDPPPPDGWGVYVKDRSSGAIELVSIDEQGQPFAGLIQDPDISADGRYVTFYTMPSYQVWLRDRWSRTTRLVSHDPDGLPANGQCGTPRISRDGSTIVFASFADNLVPGTPVSISQVFAYDVATGAVSVVSVSASGAYGDAASRFPCVDAIGRRVAFQTLAPNLAGEVGSGWRVVLIDRATGLATPLDGSDTGEPVGVSDAPEMTPDGNFVVFASLVTNLGAPPDVHEAVFVRDMARGTLTCVSDVPPVIYSTKPTNMVSISDDGEYIAYVNDTEVHEYGWPVRRIRRTTLEADWAVTGYWGEPALAQPWPVQLSPHGEAVLFMAHEFAILPFGTELYGRVGPFIQTFSAPLPADLTHDGHVNGADLALVLDSWGTSGPGALDGDGEVGAGDLAVLLGAWTG